VWKKCGLRDLVADSLAELAVHSSCVRSGPGSPSKCRTAKLLSPHTMLKSRNASNRFACMDNGDEFGRENSQRTCVFLHVAVFQRAGCPSFQARWKLPT